MRRSFCFCFSFGLVFAFPDRFFAFLSLKMILIESDFAKKEAAFSYRLARHNVYSPPSKIEGYLLLFNLLAFSSSFFFHHHISFLPVSFDFLFGLIEKKLFVVMATHGPA